MSTQGDAAKTPPNVEFKFDANDPETLKFLADLAEKDGKDDIAAKFRAKAGAAQATRTQKILNKNITVKTALIVLGAGGLVILVYEGIRYALREKYPNMWAAFGRTYAERGLTEGSANVRQLRRAA